MAHLGETAGAMDLRRGADGTLTVVLRGEFDILVTEALRTLIATALAFEASNVVVDATDLTYVDSSGIAVLLRLARRYGDLEIRNAPNIVRQVIEAAGLSTRLRCVSAPRRDWRQAYPAELLSVREARAFVLETLHEVDRETREVAAVLVAELATNAVLHAESSFEVAIHVGVDVIRVDVTDSGPGMPVLVDPDLDAEMGRGLKMVDGLASRWGVLTPDGGASKTVRFELDRPDSAFGPRRQ